MLLINIVVTYGSRLIFRPCIFKVRHNSTRYTFTAYTVFYCTIFYLGVFPEIYYSEDDSQYGRKWYLKAGSLYTMYFVYMIFSYPIETFVFWIFTLIHKK